MTARPSTVREGRPLSFAEFVAIGVIFLIAEFVSPHAHRTVVFAVLLVPIAVYNAYVERGRVSYVLILIAVLLLAAAIAFPPSVPTGPAPE